MKPGGRAHDGHGNADRQIIFGGRFAEIKLEFMMGG